MVKYTVLALLLFTALKPAQAQTAPPFWQDIAGFKKMDSVQPPPAHPIVLVGSSSFTRWTNVNAAFPGYPIVNRGFGGSVLPDLVRYAYDVIIRYQPKQVIVYCGDNDLASGDSTSVAEVVLRVKTLYGMVRTNLPEAVFSFVSIKPSPSRAGIQKKVRAANAQIKAFLKTQKKTDFINVYDPMLDTKGAMREELYVADRLHMKPEGYEIWKKVMLPYLQK